MRKKSKENQINKKSNRTIFYYLKDQKLGIFLYILFTTLNIACSTFLTIIFANALDKLTQAINNNALFKEALIMFLFATCLSLLNIIIKVMINIIYNKFSTKTVNKINNDLAYQAFKLSSQAYSNNNTGTFVQRIVSDPQVLINRLVGIVDYISGIISTVVILIYVIVINYIVGLIGVAIIGICFVVERYRLKKRKKDMKIMTKNRDKINSLTTEIVKSEKDIKSLGLEEQLKSISEKNYNDFNKSVYDLSMHSSLLQGGRNIILEIASIIILTLGVVMVDKGLLTFASFMIIYSNKNVLHQLVLYSANIFEIVADTKFYSKRIFELYDENKFKIEKFGNVKLEKVVGKIEFRNVSYGYVDERNKENNDLNKKNVNIKNENEDEIIKSRNEVFNNLSFKIAPNSTVAFVGKSGSGKSTILNLMSKMYEVDDGEVLIDDVNINDLDKETLRNSISLVNQFPYIFDMTIKENLLLAKEDATDEEINDAICKASLKEFIDSLYKGIDTKVGESGIKLSGGQKQRLAIARALLRNSSIIIFDESTSSLDNIAQEYVKRSIDELKGSSTIVIVAHRLSTIRNVDKIYFLDEGKIIDEGTFEELFDKDEKFRRMFLAEDLS